MGRLEQFKDLFDTSGDSGVWSRLFWFTVDDRTVWTPIDRDRFDWYNFEDDSGEQRIAIPAAIKQSEYFKQPTLIYISMNQTQLKCLAELPSDIFGKRWLVWTWKNYVNSGGRSQYWIDGKISKVIKQWPTGWEDWQPSIEELESLRSPSRMSGIKEVKPSRKKRDDDDIDHDGRVLRRRRRK